MIACLSPLSVKAGFKSPAKANSFRGIRLCATRLCATPRGTLSNMLRRRKPPVSARLFVSPDLLKRGDTIIHPTRGLCTVDAIAHAPGASVFVLIDAKGVQWLDTITRELQHLAPKKSGHRIVLRRRLRP